METRPSSIASRAYAVLAYAAFVAATLWGVMFLAGVGPAPDIDSREAGATWSALLIDLGLLLAFALQHSVMARAEVKRWLTRVVPGPLERSTYVLAAGLLMGLLFWQWRAFPAVVWQLHDEPWVALVSAAYLCGWVVAISSTFMTDHAEFLGLRQAGWLGERSWSSTTLSRRWLYAGVRHPMMLGLIIAFWATPSMSAGHLLFALGASGYIVVGVHFEERDLRRQLGDAYRAYAEEVPRLLPRLAPLPVRPSAGQGLVGGAIDSPARQRD